MIRQLLRLSSLLYRNPEQLAASIVGQDHRVSYFEARLGISGNFPSHAARVLFGVFDGRKLFTLIVVDGLYTVEMEEEARHEQ
jgi:hypothetical protein